jgi:hypothetical protein
MGTSSSQPATAAGFDLDTFMLERGQRWAGGGGASSLNRRGSSAPRLTAPGEPCRQAARDAQREVAHQEAADGGQW